MTASDPFEGHSPLALLLIILVGLILAAGLAVYGFSTMARQGVWGSGPGTLLRSLAALAAAAAAAVYVWGAVHLALMDDTAVTQACRDAVGQARAAGIDRYEAGYIPLRLGCHVAGDGTYAGGVPGYVNPAALGFALTAAALAACAPFAPESRARDNSKKKTSS